MAMGGGDYTPAGARKQTNAGGSECFIEAPPPTPRLFSAWVEGYDKGASQSKVCMCVCTRGRERERERREEE